MEKSFSGNCWIVESSYNFPEANMDVKNLSFQIYWPDEFKWLACSKIYKRAFGE